MNLALTVDKAAPVIACSGMPGNKTNIQSALSRMFKSRQMELIHALILACSILRMTLRYICDIPMAR
ncbi:hypothetical protein D3C73_1033330 [compost metagenome]